MLRILILVLTLVVTFPATAKADPDEELKLCMCQQAMGRMLCKNPELFQYIGMKGLKTYVFNVFYGSQNTNFLCTVTDEFVHVTSPAWIRAQRTVLYIMDPETKCASGKFLNPECGMSSEFKCCRRKTPEESLREKDNQFWEKDIPANLPPPPGADGNSSMAANGSDTEK